MVSGVLLDWVRLNRSQKVVLNNASSDCPMTSTLVYHSLLGQLQKYFNLAITFQAGPQHNKILYHSNQAKSTSVKCVVLIRYIAQHQCTIVITYPDIFWSSKCVVYLAQTHIHYKVQQKINKIYTHADVIIICTYT